VNLAPFISALHSNLLKTQTSPVEGDKTELHRNQAEFYMPFDDIPRKFNPEKFG